MKWLARLSAIVLVAFGGLFVYLGNIGDYVVAPLFALMFIVCIISALFLFLLSGVLK